MSEKNEVVVRQMIEDVWNRKRLQTIENFCAPDYINHDPQAPTTGLAAFRESVQKYHTAFPDLRVDIDELVSAGDRVIVRWRAKGTQRGPLEGLAPTGRQVAITGISITRFSGEKIREEFVNWDALGMMQQLGAVTLPGKSATAGV